MERKRRNKEGTKERERERERRRALVLLLYAGTGEVTFADPLMTVGLACFDDGALPNSTRSHFQTT